MAHSTDEETEAQKAGRLPRGHTALVLEPMMYSQSPCRGGKRGITNPKDTEPTKGWPEPRPRVAKKLQAQGPA